MRYVKYLLVLLFAVNCASLINAQTLAVTATITDSDSTAWADGTWSVQVFSPNGVPFYNGTQVSTAVQKGSLSNSGALAVTLNNTSTITPSGATYTWTICPNASAPCSSFNLGITTTNQSAALSAQVKAPRFAATSTSYGYADVEVSPTPLPGAFYYNVLSTSSRQWNGTAWVVFGGGGGGGGVSGSGTAGIIPSWTGATSLGNSVIDLGVSNINSLSILPPVDNNIDMTTSGTGLMNISAGGIISIAGTDDIIIQSNAEGHNVIARTGGSNNNMTFPSPGVTGTVGILEGAVNATNCVEIAPDGIGIRDTGAPCAAAPTCPLVNATNICITTAPYNASIAGGTTTTISTNTTPGTTVSVVSCSTFNAGNGVLILGAGTGGSTYLGNVVSCVGSTMLVSPATISSVPTGRVVQHDETAAFNAAIAYLASLPNPSGTIWLPDGSYLVNGPLQDTGGANAIIPLPKIPNYTSTLSKIAIEGYTDPNNAQINGAIITTSQNTGNLFAGYDSSTAGPYPPFTNAELTLKNLTFFAPDNPGIVVVNATNLQALTAQNLAIRTVTVPLPSNTAGGGIFFPNILNSYQNHMDNVTIAGFYNNVKMTEHTQVGSLYSEDGVNCAVFDNGTNPNTPATYQGNSVSVDYLWTFNCTNSVASGTGVTTINVQNADFELSTGNDVVDTANLLYGVINAHNPYAPHVIGISGAANLSVRNLWEQGGINFGGPTTPGYGSTIAFNEQGISGTPNVFLTNSKANTLSVDLSAIGDHQGTIFAGSVAAETSSIFGTYLTAINDSYGTGASANIWQFLAQGNQIANYPRSAAILNSQTGNINFIFTDGSETLGSATTLTWSGFTPTIDGVPDTGISRINPDVVGIGNGTYGDISGELEAGSLSIGTTAALPAATTINTQNVCLANGTNCPIVPTGLSGMSAGQVPIAATSTTVTSSKALAGTGAGITTGPTTATATDVPAFTSTTGGLVDSGISISSLAVGLSIPTGTTTFTPGTGVTSVACTSGFTCTNTRGNVTITEGTATTGIIATINFSAALSTAPGLCTVTQNGGITTLALGHGVATTTSFTITAGISLVGTSTVSADYTCRP